MARPGMLQRRRKANWEKGVDKEGIQYLFLIAETKGLNRPIMPESSMARRGTFQRRKSEGQEESQLLPLIASDLRAGLDHTDDAQIKYGPPRKVPKEKGQMGEGSRQGREPTPPPNHQDLRAELDDVD
ncbi:hypothetical protein EV363DRAFT_1456762 [Boletus edulis]|nr:hypothetical protein EV363DRAFT_1456762 [Boletus edulis]